MKLGPKLITIKGGLIRRNWKETEMRLRINESKVAQYAQEMSDGATFPPPVAFTDFDEVLRIGDGFHRILAARMNKQKQITVEVRKGGFKEAFLYNIEANKQQKGLPFSLGDKEKCILTILQNKDTSAWSGSKIAETVGCSNGYTSLVCTAFRESGGIRPDVTVSSNGVERHRYVSREPEDVQSRREKAAELFANGQPKIAIARQLGIGRFAVQRYLKDAVDKKEMIECPHCHGTGMIVNPA